MTALINRALEELISHRPLPARIAESQRLLREGDLEPHAASLAWATYALQSAVADVSDEAEGALQRARASAAQSHQPGLEVVSALIMLEAGAPTRSVATLELAAAAGSLESSVAGSNLGRILLARAQFFDGAPSRAAETISRALSTLEGELRDRPGPLGALGALVAAEIALPRDIDQAREHLEQARASGSCSGLLDTRATVLGARLALYSDPPQPDQARRLLLGVCDALEHLGARRDLAFAYVAMADTEEVAGHSQEHHPVEWVMRAWTLLSGDTSPRVSQILQRAFRRHGRRAVDQHVRADMAGAIETVRLDLARLAELIEGIGDLAGSSDPDAAVHARQRLRDAARAARQGHEALIARTEVALVDSGRIESLAAVGRRITTIDDPIAVQQAICTHALVQCNADVAELVEVSPTSGVTTLARFGRAPGYPSETSPLHTDPPDAEVSELAMAAAARGSVQLRGWRDADDAHPAPARGARIVVWPLGTATPLALCLRSHRRERGLSEGEVNSMTLYATLAGLAWSRCSAGAKRDAAALRHELVGESSRDGLLTIDAEGKVRSINAAALHLLEVDRDRTLGQPLRTVTRLRPLNALIESPTSGDTTVRIGERTLVARPATRDGQAAVSVRSADPTPTERPTRAAAGSTRRSSPPAPSQGDQARYAVDDMVGSDAAFQACLKMARSFAPTDLPILITGETGVGKEVMAQAIHGLSHRSQEPFVGVNAAAIPRDLIESELFGYEGGAFSGARPEGKLGQIELAGTGTLMLDEIGEIPVTVQAKLLRVLDERMLRRLGGTRMIPIGARFVAATNVDLDTAIRDGDFRLDLLHRLRGAHIQIPPLRERSDIADLILHYVNKTARSIGRGQVNVAPHVMDALLSYAWPGNIRELANVIAAEVSILPAHLDVLGQVPQLVRDHTSTRPRPSRESAQPGATTASSPVRSFADVERAVLDNALHASGGHVNLAAEALGMAKSTLYAKIQRYDLPLSGTPLSVAMGADWPRWLLGSDGSIRNIAEVEREAIAAALEHFEGRVPDAAKALGMAKSTLYAKIKRLELDRDGGLSDDGSDGDE